MVFCLAGCSTGSASTEKNVDSNKLKVVATNSIIADMVENVGQKQLAAETHHAPEGLEADGESRSPGGKMQVAEIDHTDVDDTLGSDPPV